jgi:Flp pilus assembly pilin Flp
LADNGAATVEYTLLAVFIAIAALAAIGVFGGAVRGLFEQGEASIPSIAP